MKTERDEKSPKKYNLIINEDNLKNKFVKYINTLSESIKEYYKVSTNIIQNENILINILEGELFKIIQKKNKKEIQEILNKIKININSGKANLMNFFEDAKIVFKEMKNYQDSLKKKLIKQNSYVGSSSNNNEFLNNFEPRYQCSEINYKNERNQIDIDIIGSNFKKIKKEFSDNTNERRISAKQRIPKQTKNMKINMMNKSYNTIESMKILENLKKINKNYELKIKYLNLELQKLKNSNDLNDINENIKIQNELSLNKDNIISSLKEELEKVSRKNNQLFNNYRNLQTRAKSFKEENNKLNSLIKSDRKIINELKIIIHKNNQLNANNDLTRTSHFSPKSDLNYNVNQNKYILENLYNYNANIILKNEIDLLKKKTIYYENQIKEEKIKNENLTRENILLKNKTESELLKLSKGNNELSENLIN